MVAAQVIRCSQLPTVFDCMRKNFVKQYPELVAAAGYTLRPDVPTVSKVMGTAVHATITNILKAQFEGKTLSFDDSLEKALVEFDIEITTGDFDPEDIYDPTTKNRDVAQFMIQRMSAIYWNHTARHIRADMVEEKLSMRLSEDGQIVLNGSMDIYEKRRLIDIKSGSNFKAYDAQAGGYYLLLDATGKEEQLDWMTPQEICIDWIRRTPKTISQDPPVRITYDIKESVKAARTAIAALIEIKKDFEQYQDLERMGSNNYSMMCGTKYCNAALTDACTRCPELQKNEIKRQLS